MVHSIDEALELVTQGIESCVLEIGIACEDSLSTSCLNSHATARY